MVRMIHCLKSTRVYCLPLTSELKLICLNNNKNSYVQIYINFIKSPTISCNLQHERFFVYLKFLRWGDKLQHTTNTHAQNHI